MRTFFFSLIILLATLCVAGNMFSQQFEIQPPPAPVATTASAPPAPPATPPATTPPPASSSDPAPTSMAMYLAVGLLGAIIIFFLIAAGLRLRQWLHERKQKKQDATPEPKDEGDALVIEHPVVVTIGIRDLGVYLNGVTAKVRPASPVEAAPVVAATPVADPATVTSAPASVGSAAGLVSTTSALALLFLFGLGVASAASPTIKECHQTAPPNNRFTATDGVWRRFICTGSNLGAVTANGVSFATPTPVRTVVNSTSASTLTFSMSALVGSEGEYPMFVNGYAVGKPIAIVSLAKAGDIEYTLRQARQLVPTPATPVKAPLTRQEYLNMKNRVDGIDDRLKAVEGWKPSLADLEEIAKADPAAFRAFIAQYAPASTGGGNIDTASIVAEAVRASANYTNRAVDQMRSEIGKVRTTAEKAEHTAKVAGDLASASAELQLGGRRGKGQRRAAVEAALAAYKRN